MDHAVKQFDTVACGVGKPVRRLGSAGVAFHHIFPVAIDLSVYLWYSPVTSSFNFNN